MANKENAPAGKELVAAKEQAIALQNDTLNFLSEHAGAGAERVSMNDIIMPRLSILQDLSPQVNKRKPEYIEGAEPGLIFNAATLQLSKSVRVVAAKYIRHHIEWKQNRGGFVADHGDDESIMQRVHHRDDKSFDILDNGNIIMPTPTWYCLDVGNDLAQVVIPMPRTQSRTSRSWMAQATNEKLTHPTTGERFQAPLFFRSWDLTTAIKEDGQNSWFVWQAVAGPSVMDMADGQPLLPVNTMQAAIRFKQLLDSGVIKADASHFEDGAEGRGDGAGGQRGDTF